jgi:carboxynorspermidine decarboxylase
MIDGKATPPPGDSLTTPAFVFRPSQAISQIDLLRSSLNDCEFRLLYSVKACNLWPVITALSPYVDGFSVSSLFEAQLVAHAANEANIVHLVTPAVQERWLTGDVKISHVILNSLTQWASVKRGVDDGRKWAIRMNPRQTIVEDARYDPCRKHSKLGVDLSKIVAAWSGGGLSGMTGLHVHNGCLCESWLSLKECVLRLASEMPAMMSELRWINLGGGYTWTPATDFVPLIESIQMLTDKFGLDVFLEPGAGIVNESACLIASVIDILESDGENVAILDTTVNHLPEVFEYQFEPDVIEHDDAGEHRYILAGCSCLAGDLFGHYSFIRPLKIGSRVTFANVGAYSLVKANMFNGINLPSIYVVDEEGNLELNRMFGFDDFAARCGLQINEYANS